MNCPKCKSYDITFDEKKPPIIYSCNGCGHQWKGKGTEFEEFLQEVHYEDYTGEGNNIGEDFEKWLSNLDIDKWLILGEWFANRKATQVLSRIFIKERK